MGKKRRSFGKEFKLEAVKLVKTGGLSVSAAAQDLGICETSLRRWVHQYEVDHGEGPEGAMTSQEKEELSRLRRDNRRLRVEREILKKATVGSTGHCNTRLRSVALRSVVHGTNRTTWPL